MEKRRAVTTSLASRLFVCQPWLVAGLVMAGLLLLVGIPAVAGPFLATILPTSHSTGEALAASGPTQAPPRDIPTVLTELNLGVPAGNGYGPHQVAIDGRSRRLYTLNEGLTSISEGITISMVDLATAEITRLLKLGLAPGQSAYGVQPLDLQVDPYRPRLYAIWGDPYADPSATNLTIIDTDNLTVIPTLPGVAAVAPGPDRLYLANGSRLWAVAPSTQIELASQELEPSARVVFLLLDAGANRLYLGRNQPAGLALFTADALAPAGSLAVTDRLIDAAVDEIARRIFIVSSDGQQVTLAGLDSDGRPVAELAPVVLSADTYGTPSVALAGQMLAAIKHLTTGSADQLLTLARSDLAPAASLPIPGYPNDIALDPVNGQVYATYSSPASYILAINPASGAAKKIYTAITLDDALADPATGRLYVLNNRGTVQVLNLSDYAKITAAETLPQQLNCQEPPGCIPAWSAVEPALALDPGRQRLYISGAPARIIDTVSLRLDLTLATPGQVTPDPSSDRVYLTPPCQCRLEQCNTLILNADTLTGTQTIFPPTADLFAVQCVSATSLDPVHQLLYTLIYNGIPGSNSGSYFAVFDVAGPPHQIYMNSNISFGPPALDPLRGRAFMARYRMDRSFLNRFEAQGETISQTLELAGAGGWLLYAPEQDRLYAVADTSLQLFNGDLALLTEISLPGPFKPLTFDSSARRLYLAGLEGNLLVMAASGGQLEPPPPPTPAASTATQPLQQLFVAANAIRFQIENERLYRSTDNGQNWQLLGRGLPAQPVMSLAISPNYAADQTLLVSLGGYGRSGGIYRSTDGGETWQPVTAGLTDLAVNRIVFSPTFAQDQTVFVNTPYKGLFRSTDGGQTWTALAGGYEEEFSSAGLSDLAVSPTFAQDSLILAGYRHLLRSTDGGNTWQNTNLPEGRIAFSPTFAQDGLILLNGQWRSTDRGQSWQPSASGLAPARSVLRLFFSPGFAQDQTVYILLDRGYDAPRLLQRSTDAGRSWETLLGGLPPAFDLAAVETLPDGKLYLSAAGQETTVAPESLTWGSLPVDISQIELQALAMGSAGALYVANSAAGVFESTDGGRTWQETGYPARASDVQLARLALAQNGTLFAAAGRAVERSLAKSGSWTYLAGLSPSFEVASLAVSPTFAQDGLVLAGGTYASNRLMRSTDGGQTWQTVFDGQSLEGAADLNLLAFSPDFAANGLVYAWLQEVGLLRSTDQGRTWAPVSPTRNQYAAQSLLVAAGGRLYLGILGGRVLLSVDGGQSWQELNSGLPDNLNWSSALALAPDGSLFLGTDEGIYRSAVGSQSWSPANSGLPLDPNRQNLPQVRALAFHNGRLYAALVQGGLYISDDLGQSWQNAATAPPASQASPTPAPTPLPLATATSAPPACPHLPANFLDLWQARVAQLGCPTGSQQSLTAEQTFEGGRMFWRNDNGFIYALPDGQPYRRYEDTWNDSQPAYACPDLGPSQTPPTPQRGFGKVWCNDAGLRQQLGNVTGEERPMQAIWQDFEHGLIFRTAEGVTYILAGAANNWESLR